MLWVMLQVTTVAVFVTSSRSSRVQATNMGKVIDRRDANPYKEGAAQARRHSRGFESRCKQNIFCEISVKLYLNNNLVAEIVH